MLTCVQGGKTPAAEGRGGRAPVKPWVGEGPREAAGVLAPLREAAVSGAAGRVWAGCAGAAPEALGSISPTIPLWSYLALLDIDPGRPLVDSLIEN